MFQWLVRRKRCVSADLAASYVTRDTFSFVEYLDRVVRQARIDASTNQCVRYAVVMLVDVDVVVGPDFLEARPVTVLER